MLLWLRPFRVGDYIETQNFAGRVHEIGLFVSHLETFDGLFVFAPNSTLWNVWMRNHSRAASRLLAWSVTVPRDMPFDEAKQALIGAWAREGADGRLSEPVAFLDQLTADSQVLVLRGRVTEGETATAQRRIAEAVRLEFVERFGRGASRGDPAHRARRQRPLALSWPGRGAGGQQDPRQRAPEAPSQGVVTTPEH